MTDLTFTLEEAPKSVVRPHKYDGVIKALQEAPEGQQLASVFPDENAVESFLNAVRTLARNAGFSVKTSEKRAVENGIKLGIVRVERRTRRTAEEVAAEKAAKAKADAEAKANTSKGKK